jgi:hypothetical protein
MLDRIDQNPNCLSNVMFSDEATFHTCGYVNRHKIRIWGSENPHSVREHIRDSKKGQCLVWDDERQNYRTLILLHFANCNREHLPGHA